jgi:hypothetical protein
LTQRVPLSLERHAARSWLAPKGYDFAAGDIVLPLGLTEASHALLSMALGFVRLGEEINLVALVGLQQSQNLFVDRNGSWRGDYIPFLLRTYPFALSPTSNDELVMCVLEPSPCILENTKGAPFFEPEGSLHPVTQKILEALVAFERDRKSAARAAAALDKLNLLKDWQISLPPELGGKKLQGLLCVDEAAIFALSDEDFLFLRRNEGLNLAYCQMLSMRNLSKLTKLLSERPPPVAPVMELDFSSFGG